MRRAERRAKTRSSVALPQLDSSRRRGSPSSNRVIQSGWALMLADRAGWHHKPPQWPGRSPRRQGQVRPPGSDSTVAERRSKALGVGASPLPTALPPARPPNRWDRPSPRLATAAAARPRCRGGPVNRRATAPGRLRPALVSPVRRLTLPRTEVMAVVSRKQQIEMLRRVPLFSDLTRQELDQLARSGRVVDHAPRSCRCHRGREGCRIPPHPGRGGPCHQGRPDRGQARSRGMVRRGLDDRWRPRTATVAAATPLRTFGLASWDFHPLLRSSPPSPSSCW